MSRGALRTLVCALAVAFGACEPKLVPATQAVVTLQSALRTELTSIEVVVYDVNGQNRGGSYEFDLRSVSLPFSFTVVPMSEKATSFRFVLTGKASDGTPILESKAIIRFVSRETVRVDVWLIESCVQRFCEESQTCTGAGAGGGNCVDVPMLDGQVVPPSDLRDGAVAVATSAVEAGAQAPMDAGSADVDSADEASAVDETDTGIAPDDGASPAPTSGACTGNAGQALCSANQLSVCDDQGQLMRQDTCASPRQCQLGIASRACAQCEPGTFRCLSDRLERCADDGLKWQPFKTCESEALCNPRAGDCTAGACTATTRVCMASDLYRCNVSLTELERVQACDAGMCDQVAGECDRCLQGARTCSAGYAEICDDRGQVLTRTQCTGATPKCNAGQCVQCTVAGDCPTPSNPCQSAACNATSARCAVSNRAAHAACTGGVCNGSGACVQCVDGTDCPSDARICQNARCVQCRTTADCAAGHECTASNICQRVSLAGTATGCNSSAAATSTQCSGYYCGVTPTRLASALVTTAVCNQPSAQVCSGEIWQAGQVCWREVKIANLFENNQVLRPKVESCMRARANLQELGAPCIACYLDSGQCMGDNCSLECLSDESADCDRCRLANNCIEPFYACTGLPNPF